MAEDEYLLDSGRWNVIYSKTRARCHGAFLAKVADAAIVRSRPDIESIKRCVQDPGIVDYFTRNGWINARKRGGK